LLLSLSWKYWLLVFLAVLGILQGAAARNNLRGLFFFRYRAASYVFAALAIGFPLVIFFSWNSRYATSVIEGSEQAGLFTLAALAAILSTLVVSSAIRSALFKRQVTHRHGLRARRHGLPALQHATIYHILRDKANGRH
jgi:hypothetical protein